MVPTTNQIATQVEAVLDRHAEARCIAIRSPARDAWPDSLMVRNRVFQVRWCASPLAARQALVEAEDVTLGGIVLVTRLGDAELGSDVMARLARGRVFQVERWDMVRQVFQANEIDSRLARRTWMAQALLEHLPAGGYLPVAGGFLDLDTAWKAVLKGTLDMEEARPDILSLLRWSMSSRRVARFGLLPDAAQPQVLEWIAECSGPVGELVMSCVASGHGLDALPLGLLCGVVFGPGSEGQPELAAASVRLERFTGNRRISLQHGRRWAESAAWLLRSVSPEEARPYLERAEGLLRELHLSGFAILSDVLPMGLNARLEGFATAIQSFLEQPSEPSLAAVEQAASLALGHTLGSASGSRMERVFMARRLVRWLLPRTGQTREASGLPALARRYVGDMAYVDWARFKLSGGDELAVLTAAYSDLADAVRKQREGFSQRFATALKAWNADLAVTEDCLPVEAILDRLIGPLAQQASLLLLVVDGLSYPIFRELCADLAREGWVEHIGEQAEAALLGIAALPTVTETSRASLLSGRLVLGASHQEKTSFAAHPALLAASRAGGKPVLFHKGELGDASGLSQQVRDVVGDSVRKVVAVVYNAVDDHLSGSDQLHQRWSLDDLRLLKPLLHEARSAGRTLVITADHGHVIDEKTIQRSAADGDRWRSVTSQIAEDEILLSGGRVLASNGANQIVCAWSELVRYSSKKNGYHGGVSPQEVVVPLSIFLSPLASLVGWKAAPPSQPEWWEGSAGVPAQVPQVRPVAPKRKARDVATADLFGTAETAEASADWIAGLLASATYQLQRRLAARVAPSDQEIRALLVALDDRGGKLGKAALAQKLGIALMRVSGFVNVARRVLNVDQAAVLSLDETAAQVELNRELLEVQFQLRTRNG